MNAFELDSPTTLADALGALQHNDGSARIIAGGTGLLNLMKQGFAQPERLISLHQLPDLDGISEDGAGNLMIGALTPLSHVAAAPLIATHAPLLARVLTVVASPRIRAMATIGGAIAHGDPSQDTPPALIALDATVCARSLDDAGEIAERWLPLSEFYQDFYETALADNELITHVRIPCLGHDVHADFVKYVPRSAEDYATAMACAVLQADPTQPGRLRHARLTLGSAGATPLRIAAAETALMARTVDAESIAEAANLAVAASDPMDDARGTAQYKQAMIRVHVVRLLERLTADLASAGATI